MHMTKTYENLRDMLEREVTEIEQKGSLDAQSLDHLFKLMTTLKNTDKCLDREEGNSYGMMRSYRMPYMNDGRYSRDNFRGDSYRGGSYDRPYEYSRDSRQDMMNRLEQLMNEATNENERQAIRDCMSKI